MAIFCLTTIILSGGEGAAKKKRRYIRQAVTLTGLGSATFQKGVDNVAHTFITFMNNFPDGKVESWQSTMFEGHVALDMHARYLTERRLAPQESHIEYGYMVDPDGVLSDIQGTDYIHGPDNCVEYLEMRKTNEGQTK